MGLGIFSPCVLIADDDVEICDLISAKLNELGMTTIIANEGFEASKYVENQKFAAIILDLNMPIVKGLQIASRARSGKPNRNTPIFIVSGFLQKEVLIKSKALGINGVFAKPFSLDELIPKIMAAIGPKEVEGISKERKIEYDQRIIKCFISGAVEVLKFYFTDEEVKIGSPFLREPTTPRNLYASAVIPITSDQFTGSMSLGLPVTFIKKWISKMFDDPNFKIDNEIIGSTTGELCNQILGIVNDNFSKIGVTAESGTPVLAIGKGHQIQHTGTNVPIVIPIQFGDTGIELEFCLSKTFVNVSNPAATAAAAGDELIEITFEG